METKAKNGCFIILYIVLTALSCLSIFDGMPTAFKLCHVVIIVIAFLSFVFAMDCRNLQIIKDFTARYFYFLLLIFLITNIIWVMNLSEIENILRGYEKFAYQLIVIFAVISACYLFKEKTVDYTFFGFVLFNCISILMALKRTGLAAAIEDIRTFLTTFGDANGFMKLLELHDAAFCFGMFALYYILFDSRKRWGYRFISLFFFLLGFKRIGIAAFMVAILASFLTKRMAKEALRNACLLTGFIIMILGFIYIIITYDDIFSQIMNFFGINTMGRNDLYDFVKKFYYIGITYKGQGFEFITLLFQNAEYGTLNMSKIGALHNGFLTVYIEFGFTGFFIWNGFWLLSHMNWISRYGKETLRLYLVLTLYLFITYLTDNTAFYFYTGIIYRLLPLAFALHFRQEDLYGYN